MSHHSRAKCLWPKIWFSVFLLTCVLHIGDESLKYSLSAILTSYYILYVEYLLNNEIS